MRYKAYPPWFKNEYYIILKNTLAAGLSNGIFFSEILEVTAAEAEQLTTLPVGFGWHLKYKALSQIWSQINNEYLFQYNYFPSISYKYCQ